MRFTGIASTSASRFGLFLQTDCWCVTLPRPLFAEHYACGADVNCLALIGTSIEGTAILPVLLRHLNRRQPLMIDFQMSGRAGDMLDRSDRCCVKCAASMSLLRCRSVENAHAARCDLTGMT